MRASVNAGTGVCSSYRIAQERWMASKRVLTILCCIVVLGTVGCHVLDPEGTRQRNREQMTANQEVAVEIVNALAKYHQSVGGFPGSLEDLVPGYLSAVPDTITGERFAYYPDDLGGYSLCFYLPGYRDRGCCFHQYVCLWECSNP